MENINMGIVSTVSKNIDFASFKIEEINKEILAATIELKKIGENTELGQIIKSKIEILNDEKGRPYVNILNNKIQNIEDIDISLSHCKEYAIANVVVIFK